MEVSMSALQQLASLQTESKLLESRTLFISEAITSAVAKRVVEQLLVLAADGEKKPIYMYINSPGGEVNSGFAIYDTMRFIKPEIKVINTGLCASIATIINLGAPKKHRYTMPHAKFLIHQPLIGGHIQGQASDLEITAREIIKTRKRLNDLLSKECGQPFEKVEDDTTRDYWMNAMEAVEYGLVAKIVENIDEVG